MATTDLSSLDAQCIAQGSQDAMNAVADAVEQLLSHAGGMPPGMNELTQTLQAKGVSSEQYINNVIDNWYQFEISRGQFIQDDRMQASKVIGELFSKSYDDIAKNFVARTNDDFSNQSKQRMNEVYKVAYQDLVQTSRGVLTPEKRTEIAKKSAIFSLILQMDINMRVFMMDQFFKANQAMEARAYYKAIYRRNAAITYIMARASVDYEMWRQEEINRLRQFNQQMVAEALQNLSRDRHTYSRALQDCISSMESISERLEEIDKEIDQLEYETTQLEQKKEELEEEKQLENEKLEEAEVEHEALLNEIEDSKFVQFDDDGNLDIDAENLTQDAEQEILDLAHKTKQKPYEGLSEFQKEILDDYEAIKDAKKDLDETAPYRKRYQDLIGRLTLVEETKGISIKQIYELDKVISSFQERQATERQAFIDKYDEMQYLDYAAVYEQHRQNGTLEALEADNPELFADMQRVKMTELSPEQIKAYQQIVNKAMNAEMMNEVLDRLNIDRVNADGSIKDHTALLDEIQMYAEAARVLENKFRVDYKRDQNGEIWIDPETGQPRYEVYQHEDTPLNLDPASYLGHYFSKQGKTFDAQAFVDSHLKAKSEKGGYDYTAEGLYGTALKVHDKQHLTPRDIRHDEAIQVFVDKYDEYEYMNYSSLYENHKKAGTLDELERQDPQKFEDMQKIKITRLRLAEVYAEIAKGPDQVRSQVIDEAVQRLNINLNHADGSQKDKATILNEINAFSEASQFLESKFKVEYKRTESGEVWFDPNTNLPEYIFVQNDDDPSHADPKEYLQEHFRQQGLDIDLDAVLKSYLEEKRDAKSPKIRENIMGDIQALRQSLVSNQESIEYSKIRYDKLNTELFNKTSDKFLETYQAKATEYFERLQVSQAKINSIKGRIHELDQKLAYVDANIEKNQAMKQSLIEEKTLLQAQYKLEEQRKTQLTALLENIDRREELIRQHQDYSDKLIVLKSKLDTELQKPADEQLHAVIDRLTSEIEKLDEINHEQVEEVNQLISYVSQYNDKINACSAQIKEIQAQVKDIQENRAQIKLDVKPVAPVEPVPMVARTVPPQPQGMDGGEPAPIKPATQRNVISIDMPEAILANIDSLELKQLIEHTKEDIDIINQQFDYIEFYKEKITQSQNGNDDELEDSMRQSRNVEGLKELLVCKSNYYGDLKRTAEEMIVNADLLKQCYDDLTKYKGQLAELKQEGVPVSQQRAVQMRIEAAEHRYNQFKEELEKGQGKMQKLQNQIDNANEYILIEEQSIEALGQKNQSLYIPPLPSRATQEAEAQKIRQTMD